MRGFKRVWDKERRVWRYHPSDLKEKQDTPTFKIPHIEIPWIPIISAIIIAVGVMGAFYLFSLIKIQPAPQTTEPIVIQTPNVMNTINTNANAMINDLSNNPINLILILGVPIITLSVLGAFDSRMFRRTNWLAVGGVIFFIWFVWGMLK
jgi:hypothetical protein